MLNTIERKINEIKPYKGNAKKHSETQIKNVAESIRQFGFRQPIVLDKNNVIIIGHCRYEAAKLLNLETVPCNIAADLSSDQVKKLRNLDNKLNESEWDFDLLREDISDLDFSDFDIDWDLPEVENKSEIIEDEAPEVDEENEPITQLGDIWELGEHRLMCGDSTNKATLEKLMNGKKADLVFTDPPYGMSVVSRSGVLSKMYTTDILNDDTNKVAIASFMLSQKKFSQAKQVWWGRIITLKLCQARNVGSFGIKTTAQATKWTASLRGRTLEALSANLHWQVKKQTVYTRHKNPWN